MLNFISEITSNASASGHKAEALPNDEKNTELADTEGKSDPNILAYSEIKQRLSLEQKELKQQKIVQAGREADYLLNYSVQVCPAEEALNSINNFTAEDSTRLEASLAERFYDPNVMKSIQCLTNSLVYYPSGTNEGATDGQRIRYWIRNLRPISTGVIGLALKGNFAEARDLFALKITKGDNLTHEFVIATQLNKLRRNLPNFVYIYAGFNCSFTGVGQLGWCWGVDRKAPVTTLFYENVADSPTLSSLNAKLRFDEWLNFYLQVLYSLRFAYKSMNFTHYDLHANNVLIRSLPDLVYIPYTTENNQVEYLLTSSVATIIDFDRSHLRIDGVNYGDYNLLEYGVNPLKGRPLHDAYKLLLFSMRDMLHSTTNTQNIEKMAQILKYFFPDSTAGHRGANKHAELTKFALDIIHNEGVIYYSLRDDNTIDKLSLDGLLKYIRRCFPTPFLYPLPQTSISVLDCTAFKCESTFKITGDNPSAKTLFEFYDRHSRLAASSPKLAKLIYDQFKPLYQEEISSGLQEFIDLKNTDMRHLNQGFSIILIDGMIPEKLESTEIVQEYRQQINRLIKLYDLLQQSKFQYSTSIYAAIQYKDETSNNKLDSGRIQWIVPLESMVVQAKQHLKRDMDYIKSLNYRWTRDIWINLNTVYSGIQLTTT